MRLTSASLGALLIEGIGRARAQPVASLIVQLEALCRRLAPLGWQKMMLAVTGGALDITAPDLARELAKPVAIDRTYPGFGDFALAGNRGIEPGRPDESLLYHALAAPTVVSNPAGRPLGGFPTIEEIETVENYIYAARAATLNALRAAASLGTQYDGPTHTLKRYLAGHGLGSPFIEDAKLCAALGSYWPAAAPDATREYEPNKPLSGVLYPWPSIVPLTDTEIGMVAAGRQKNRQIFICDRRELARHSNPFNALTMRLVAGLLERPIWGDAGGECIRVNT